MGESMVRTSSKRPSKSRRTVSCLPPTSRWPAAVTETCARADCGRSAQVASKVLSKLSRSLTVSIISATCTSLNPPSSSRICTRTSRGVPARITGCGPRPGRSISRLCAREDVGSTSTHCGPTCTAGPGTSSLVKKVSSLPCFHAAHVPLRPPSRSTSSRWGRFKPCQIPRAKRSRSSVGISAVPLVQQRSRRFVGMRAISSAMPSI